MFKIRPRATVICKCS